MLLTKYFNCQKVPNQNYILKIQKYTQSLRVSLYLQRKVLSTEMREKREKRNIISRKKKKKITTNFLSSL